MFPASAHTTTSESNGPRKQRAVDKPLGVETRHPCNLSRPTLPLSHLLRMSSTEHFMYSVPYSRG